MLSRHQPLSARRSAMSSTWLADSFFMPSICFSTLSFSALTNFSLSMEAAI